MRRVGIGTFLAVAVGVSPALAVDLAPVVEQQSPFQWQGLYFGGHVGFGKAVSTEDSNPEGGSTPEDPFWTIGGEGPVGGLFLGYNHLLGGNALLGVEVEGNVSNIIGQYNNSSYGPYYDHDWSAAARLRLGYLPAPNAVLYASFGIAAGHFDFSGGYWNSSPGDYANLNHTAYGVQIGAGAEVFVTPEVSVRAEAIYTRYAPWTFHYLPGPYDYWDVQPDTLVGRVGIVWHPGWHGGPTAGPFIEPPPASWDGFYVGAHAGLGFLDSIEDYDPEYDTPYDPYWDIGGKGGTVGIHAGVNHQFGSMVAGVEVEGNLQNIVGDQLGTSYGERYVTHGHSVGVRARLGVLATQNVLIYGSLGWAHGAFDYSDGYYSGYEGMNFNASGLQVGAGIEAFVHENVSARIEALYTNYGNHDFTSGGVPQWVVNPRTFVARAGLTVYLN